MAAPGQNPRTSGTVRNTGNPGRGTAPIHRPESGPETGRGSPSRPPASTARQAQTATAGTGPGGCGPGPADSGISWSRSTRSPPMSVITALRPRATTRGSSSGTSHRSGMPPVPAQAAEGPPLRPTSSTTSPTKRVAERVCVTADRSAATTIGSSSIRSGRSINFPTPPSNGPPRPGASTSPNPPGTPSKRQCVELPDGTYGYQVVRPEWEKIPATLRRDECNALDADVASVIQV